MPNGNVVAGPQARRKLPKETLAEKIFAVPFSICFSVVALSMWVWGPIAFRKLL